MSNDLSELTYVATIELMNNFEINTDKVKETANQGYETCLIDLDIYKYTPKESDKINYLSQDSSFELGESLSHKGFTGLEVVYERSQYEWNDFFGDLSVTEFNRDINVSLSGNSIFESDIVDEMEKYLRYYDEQVGVYYEVSDLMMGDFTDPNSTLTQNKSGMSCNYKSIEGFVPPTYNPLIRENDESNFQYFITALEDRPCLFISSIRNNKLYYKWIDIEYGLLVKEHVFNEDGLIIDKKLATSIVHKDIPDFVFNQPNDMDYKDITLFIYVADGGDVETLKNAMYDHFPKEPFGVKLTSDESEITMYTRGLSEMTPSVDDVIYVSSHTNSQGVTSRIRQVIDDRIYTIHDGLEIVEIYDKSCYEEKFFNFDDVGLLQVKATPNGKNYTFYDGNNISVSALYDVYEYVIENGKIAYIKVYEIESIADNRPLREVRSYKYELIPFDESVYDESCMETYEIRDHGEGSFNDGEYRPFWYE